MLQERPRRGRAGRWVIALVVLGLGAMFIAPIALVGAIGILTSSLFVSAGADGGAGGPDAGLVAAAEAASARCESATPARLIAVVSLPPPGQTPVDAGLPVQAWGQVLISSGQYEAQRAGEDAQLDPANTASVLDAVAIIWCALYPEIADAAADSPITLTYLALGSAASTDEATEHEPSASDQVRAAQFESLAAQYEERLAHAANAGAGSVSAEGWTHPIPGMSRYQDNYGQARNLYTHAGEDLSAALGTPIYAAAAGTVTHVACTMYEGRSPCNVIIDHGTDPDTGLRVQTWYVHMYPGGVLISHGDQVTVGQQIALTGSNGNSSGPHLHLEVHSGGQVIDPAPFFAARGVDLRNPTTAPQVSGAAGQALAWARTQIGTPYALGGTGPDTYDCSGLTMRAYEHAGATLPRTSREQYAATIRITAAQLQPGDLVFWSTDGTAAGIYHVALYAGAGRIVQAPAPGSTVEDQVLWQENLFGYGRVT
ncbi:NlpC/P60 family protein [Occultella aeris]|uniref:Putative endopeptidase p60 n=1 Tax=Occultella aeris TaxID=2761496 RepID=A0A7M4DJE9_9MICO|nr:NlpC/P60 family protein [Occultella aeris]VZO37163.1 putative endopeptidase p60 precursor [Occultella aeris]